MNSSQAVCDIDIRCDHSLGDWVLDMQLEEGYIVPFCRSRVLPESVAS